MAGQHEVAPGGGEPSVLSFAVDLDDARSHIVLRGELDEDTAALLGCVVDSQMTRGAVDVRVDLAELVFFDLRGFAALWKANDRLRDAGGRLRVVNANHLFRTVAAWWPAPELVDGSPALPAPRRTSDSVTAGDGAV